MSERLTIVCTDRGQHGRHEIGALILDPDGTVRAATVRKAAAPHLRNATAELPEDPGVQHAVPAYKYVSAPDPRADFEGRPRFSFACRTCGRRRTTWNEETARRICQTYAAARRVSIDISLMP